MLLTFFLFFLSLSIVLIALGLFKPEHTELSLIGFVFLFLLAINLLFTPISFKTGENITTSFTYIDNSSLQLNNTIEIRSYNYDLFNDSNTHNFGYWLAVASVIGFMGVFLGLRHKEGFK